MNKRMAALGTDWRGLLDVHEREGGAFDKVSWATVASKLGRLSAEEISEMKRDARVSVVVFLFLLGILSHTSCFTFFFTPSM